ncbi:hypothetical protein ACFSLT_00985 [Novosphingobium resinovorum]
MTASVAHETAQPVAAIRNYAATSRQLLDMGAEDAVRDNLSAIDRLAERIGAVTAELRGFARKGSRAGGPIPLVEVIEGACLLLKERLSHVIFVVPEVPPGLLVFGGTSGWSKCSSTSCRTRSRHWRDRRMPGSNWLWKRARKQCG